MRPVLQVEPVKKGDVEIDLGSGNAKGRPTKHCLFLADCRKMAAVPDQSVHLVLTSPPYRTLKRYNSHPQQLGHIAEYEAFLDELDHVWQVPG